MPVDLFISRILSSPQAALSPSCSSLNRPLPDNSPTTTEPHTRRHTRGNWKEVLSSDICSGLRTSQEQQLRYSCSLFVHMLGLREPEMIVF